MLVVCVSSLVLRFLACTLSLCLHIAPAVSFAGSFNVATTVGWSVTVSGVSFGAVDATPSSRLGLSSCVTSSWASSTSVVCLPTGGQGVAHDGGMTVAAIVGTRTKAFSFDGSVSLPCSSGKSYSLSLL